MLAPVKHTMPAISMEYQRALKETHAHNTWDLIHSTDSCSYSPNFKRILGFSKDLLLKVRQDPGEDKSYSQSSLSRKTNAEVENLKPFKIFFFKAEDKVTEQICDKKVFSKEELQLTTF